MDSYQFTAAIIDSRSWPVTVVIAWLLLRKNISALLPYIQKIKIKDFELDLREAKQELASVVPSDDALVGVSDFSDKRSDLYRLAAISPRSAILESWLELEAAASELAVKKTKETPGAMLAVSPLRMGEYLAKKGMISEGELQFFSRLRELRNKAIHLVDTTISEQEASDYVDMASVMARQLQGRLAKKVLFFGGT